MIFPKGGIKISYLMGEFLDDAGGIETFNGLTTEEVCQQIIKPLTLQSESSYCEILKAQGHPAFGEVANAFVSHAHSYLFEHFLDALQWLLRDEPDIILWIDLFSINQHQPMDWTFEWLSTTFKSNVAEIGRTIMVLSPWDNPEPYKRSWCVFEAYCTAISESQFEIAMSKNDEKNFLDNIQLGGIEDRIDDMLATIRSEKSECSVESDRESIFAVIRETVGFSRLDAMIFERYREWVIQVSLNALEACAVEYERLGLLRAVSGLYVSQGKYAEAEIYRTKALELSEELFGSDHPKTLKAIFDLAKVFEKQGKILPAEEKYEFCLERRKVVLGSDHSDTLISMNRLARLYGFQGKHPLAIKLYEECLERQNATVGKDHPDTLTAMYNLAVSHEEQGNYAKAEELYATCLTRRKLVLGEEHSETLETMNNLAVVLHLQGKHTEAESLYEFCLEKQKAVLGQDHPKTLKAMYSMAGMFQIQGKFSQAEDLFKFCLEKRQAILGNDHPDTLRSMNNLAVTYHMQRKYSDAIKLYKICLEKRTETLGSDHPNTLATMSNLARTLTLQGNYSEASDLYELCLERQTSVLGIDHPTTAETKNSWRSLSEQLEKSRKKEFVWFFCCPRRKKNINKNTNT